jgi:hypothetical protein
MRRGNWLIVVMVVLLIMPASLLMAQRGDDANRKSKNGKVEATINGTKLTLEYGRPKVNGRTIWGELVPFDKVWRTGADEATRITIDKSVLVENKKLAAGSYSLFTIPGKDSWTIIFNSVANQWGAFRYDATKDVLRVNVKPRSGEHVEEMTFSIEGNEVILKWEKMNVPFKIEGPR